jgi:ribose 5-phosphate isomerase A
MDYKKQAAEKAVAFIKNNTSIGLGAGSTMAHIVYFLKEAVEQGLEVQVATSSFATRQLLLQNGFAVLNTADIATLELYFDGCDQFDKHLNALKSGGGIHTQEKLLATMAKQFILVGDEAKYSEALQTKYPVVIEVLPQAHRFVINAVETAFAGTKTELRTGGKKDGAVITENGNYLMDVWFTQWPPLAGVNPAFKAIPGIVETSLFYDIAAKAIVAGENGVVVMEK